ncbi:hypothetical protein MPER_13263 [Moniliophthora perniciosa FA553]|nr:hypothetical protein MPER_13263 [Moniliophthora perniciosa FA553]
MYWNGDREELIEYLYERESGQVAVATRIRDSAKVILKIVTDPSRELAIHDFLLGINDSRNHTVPIIDRFPFRRPNGEQFHDWTIIVEPFLTFEWRVDSVMLFEETFETWKQLLESLAFMHLHNVAHRDIHPSNVRYISGISFSDGVPPQPEPSVQESRLLYPFRFYFIDFGISTKFASKRQHVGFVGGKYGHHCIPESKSAADDRSLLYDPFKADVAALGYSFNTGRIHQGRITEPAAADELASSGNEMYKENLVKAQVDILRFAVKRPLNINTNPL